MWEGAGSQYTVLSGEATAEIPQEEILRLNWSLAVLIATSLAASAGPITWNLTGVTLSDGGTATGSFTFNADAGTACGAVSPCGLFSNVNIVTTNGSSRTGATYTVVCGTNVPTCTGVSPDSTEVLFLTSTAADQSGLPGLAFFFTGVGIGPPAGLTDLGGTLNISNSSSSVGAVNEGSCIDAACTNDAAPSRASTAGFATAVPEPSSALMLGSALLIFGFGRFWRSHRRSL